MDGSKFSSKEDIELSTKQASTLQRLSSLELDSVTAGAGAIAVSGGGIAVAGGFPGYYGYGFGYPRYGWAGYPGYGWGGAYVSHYGYGLGYGLGLGYRGFYW